MKLLTLCKSATKNELIELEVTLLPGLPQIHFTTNVSKSIRDSERRIKAAIKSSGFNYPASFQIIVNAGHRERPLQSSGLDLPIALSILLLTNQVQVPSCEVLFCYGELTLDGRLKVSHESLSEIEKEKIDYALGHKNLRLSNSLDSLEQLRSFVWAKHHPLNQAPRPIEDSINREILLSKAEESVLALAVLGKFHVLFAGPPGLGKSTLARSVVALRKLVNEIELPVIEPHHSATAASLIGGGALALPGEITRAHNGILLMDEFLEFDPQIQESLREPLETKTIRLSRAQNANQYPCDLQLLATTNLCRCGQFTPGQNSCRCGSKRLKDYHSRLAGPMLDRFHMIHFVEPKNQNRQRSLLDFAQELVDKLKELNLQQGQSDQVVIQTELEKQHSQVFPLESKRRFKNHLSVAKVFTTLCRDSKLEESHLSYVSQWTISPFLRLQRDLL
jgi:magnesium chelatase family protein